MDSKNIVKIGINAVNDKILNVSILISAIFSIPTFFSSVYRINATGFNPIFIVQIFLSISAVVLYFIRNKVGFKLRLFIFLALATILIILGMFTFGVLGFWSLFIVFIVLLLSVFFSKKYGMSYLIGSIILMTIVSYLFNIKYLSLNFNVENYLNSYSVWINLMIGIAYISIMLSYPISMLRKFFVSTISELIVAKEQAEKSEELQNAKNKIEESERQFRILFEKSSDAILIIDNQRFVDCNDATVKLLKYNSKEELLDTHPSELSPEMQPDGQTSYDKANEMMDIALSKGTNRFEWLHQKKNKENFYVDVRLTAIPLEGKLITYTVWRDITERKLAESELKMKNEELIIAKNKAEESDKLKSSFLANMSHEIRTPLNGMLGFADLLKSNNLSKEKRNDFIEIINNSGNHLLDIINDIIDISKIDANQLNLIKKEFKLNTFLFEIIGFFKSIVEEKNDSKVKINFKSAFEDGNDVIYTDKTRLKQILTNLVGNAIKFTEKGFVNIEYVLGNNNEIIFSVSDTGIGIAKDELDIIFQRFRQADESNTRKFGGTGLGLAISEACTKLLGGKIWVKSEIGKGSTFSFSIPYINKDLKKEKENNGTPIAIELLENKTILIVEDDTNSYLVLKEILANYKANVLHVINGEDALEMCKKKSDIDLVLMDIQLAKLDGLKTTSLIKKKRKDLPIIAQSANAMQEDRQKSLDAGCDDYISKPVKSKELINKILKYL